MTPATTSDISWRIHFLTGEDLVVNEDVPWTQLISSITNAGGGWIQIDETLVVNPASIAWIMKE